MSTDHEAIRLDVGSNSSSEVLQEHPANARETFQHKAKVEDHWYDHLHWTRIAFVCLFISCAACAGAYFGGQNVPNILVGFFLVISAALGFALIWNYAVTKSLAESAEKLEKLAISTEGQLDEQRTNNQKAASATSTLEQTNATLANRLQIFEKSVAVLGGEVKGIVGLESKMTEIINTNEQLLAQRQKISSEQRTFLLQQQLDDLGRQKDDIKRQVRDQFDEADKDRSGYIDSADEINKMKSFLASANVPWNEKWDADGDGKLEKYELMEGLSSALDVLFDKRKSDLEAQISASQKK